MVNTLHLPHSNLRFLAAVFILVILLSGCASVEPLRDISSFPDLPRIAAEYWTQQLGPRVPGVVAAFFQRNMPPRYIAIGSAAPETGRAMTRDTVFQVASISKPITAIGILTLVDSGAIDLSAPVESYFSRYSFPPSRWNADGVTVERLLSHTAGLSLTGYPGFPPDRRLPTIEESLSGDTGLFFGIYSPPAVKIRTKPGSRWKYSGGGYTVLQLLIEEVSGMSFSAYMDAFVLQAAGMGSSTFNPKLVDSEKLAAGHNRWGKALPNYLFTAQAAAGLYSTAEDLVHLLKDLDAGLLSGGNVLNSRLYRAAITPRAEVSEGVKIGLGFHLEELPDGSTMAFHYGGNRGWQSYFGINLSRGEGMVILTNSDKGIDLLINPVLEAYRSLF